MSYNNYNSNYNNSNNYNYYNQQYMNNYSYDNYGNNKKKYYKNDDSGGSKIIIGLISFIVILGILILMPLLNNTSTKNININSMGLNLDIKKDMVAVNTMETIFNYNGTNIPSNIVQFVDSKDKSVLTIKSFPFTIEDYKSHFKSAFDSKNLIKIKKDYKKTKVLNGNIGDIYVSKANINYNDKKTKSTIYTLNFKNKKGTLILEYVGKDNIKEIVRSLEPISIDNNIKIDEYVSNIRYFNNPEEKQVQDSLRISLPEGYRETRKTLTTHNQVTYLGDKDILDIQLHPKNSNSNKKNINNLGFEKVKTTDDNKIIMYNLNNNTYCYMQTHSQDIILRGTEYTLKMYYYDYVYGENYFNEIKNSVKI